MLPPPSTYFLSGISAKSASCATSFTITNRSAGASIPKLLYAFSETWFSICSSVDIYVAKKMDFLSFVLHWGIPYKKRLQIKK